MRLIVGLFFVVALFGHPTAEASECSGRSLLDQLQRERPEVWKPALAEFDAVPNGTGLFWKIEKEGVAPSWLLGTMHVPDPRLDALRAGAAAAFESADVLALEVVDVDAQSGSVEEMMLSLAQLPEGETFDEDFTKDQKDELAHLTQSVGIPYFIARRWKPWFITIMLAVPACVQLSIAQGGLGLDDMLERDANAAGKPVIGLETIEEQVALLARLDEVIGPEDLLELLAFDLQALEDWWLTMVDLYLQERPALDLYLTRHMPEFRRAAEGFRKIEGAFLDHRNRLMRDRALPLLEEGNAFLAVGALHLHGEVGLVELLRQSGYSVTRVPLGD